jgi:hypothetical protein
LVVLDIAALAFGADYLPITNHAVLFAAALKMTGSEPAKRGSFVVGSSSANIDHRCGATVTGMSSDLAMVAWG